ncbi:unnamed protein product [Durusdinium trenchii]|uniref:Uncharacterized protein n=1 Tax=Durusdinium trenchii TaxID=1381693 RepID=A0ABP0P1P9_9DINO
MDLLSDSGFANALFWTLNLEPGSGALSAPVCSSWVFLSRGSTLRSRTNPLGRNDSECVRQGNILCGRTLVLMILCAAKGIFWCLEQPQTSCMEWHPLFQYMVRLLRVRSLRFRMSEFGAPTKKPTILYASHQCIDDILEYKVPERLAQKDMVRRYVNGAGEHRVQGGKDLKQSQSYPAGKPTGKDALAKKLTKDIRMHAKESKTKKQTDQKGKDAKDKPEEKDTKKQKQAKKEEKTGKDKEVEKTQSKKQGKAQAQQKIQEVKEEEKQKEKKEKTQKQKKDKEGKGSSKKDGEEKKEHKEVKESRKEKKEKKEAKESAKEKKEKKEAKESGKEKKDVKQAEKKRSKKKEDEKKEKKEEASAAKEGKKRGNDGKDEAVKPKKAKDTDMELGGSSTAPSSKPLEVEEEEETEVDEEEEEGEEENDQAEEEEGDEESESEENECDEEGDEVGSEEDAEEDEEEDEDRNEAEEEEDEGESSDSADYGLDGSESDSEDEKDPTALSECRALVPVVKETSDRTSDLEKATRNSTTNKREWDTFNRRLTSSKNAAVAGLSEHVAKNKVDLFNIWLDNGHDVQGACLELTRRAEATQRATAGWEAVQGRELRKRYGDNEEKFNKVVKAREAAGLFYEDQDFPGDVDETWYFMRVGSSFKTENTTSESVNITAASRLDKAGLQALTDESDGVLRAGALPEISGLSQQQNKGLLTAMAQAAPVKSKKKEKEKNKSEEVVPKTLEETAKDEMAEILKVAASSRTKSMELSNIQYAAELSKQLLDYAVSLEEIYKDLRKAVEDKSEANMQKTLDLVQKKKAFGEKAKAAAGAFLRSGPKKKKSDKKGEDESTPTGSTKKKRKVAAAKPE